VRLGLSIPFDDVGLLEQGELYRGLAAAGYTDFWTVEASGWDGFTPLVHALAYAPDVHVGTAIVSSFTRGPALLASSAAALAELAPGRFTLGLGSSSDVIVADWNGIDFTRPLTRTRDVLRFTRRALAGERITERCASFDVRGFRLDRPPAQPPRMMVAALRERMLGLAAAESDGPILSWLSADDVATVLPHAAGAKEVAARIFVCPSDDVDVVREGARRVVAAYLNVPVYRRFHEWLGRGEQLAPMWEAWERGDRRTALSLIPNVVLDELVVSGPPAACAEHLLRYVEAGVTIPIVAPLAIGMSMAEGAWRVATAMTAAAA
jgi:probable F420-dependent oxidoreductase